MALVLLLVPATGCRTKRLFTVPSGQYRVESIADNGAMLLAPPVPSRYKPDQPLEVVLTIPGKYKTDKRAGCTIREGAFALLPGGSRRYNTLKLRLPALQDWQSLLNLAAQDVKTSEHLQLSLNQFIDDVDHLIGRGCLPNGVGEPMRALILQTIPLPPQQGLYSFCEYWMGNGIVDLKPYLRLKVQRAYFAKNTTDSKPRPVGQYLGTSTIYYRVQQMPSGLSRLEKGNIEIDSMASRGRFVTDKSDLSLAESVKSMPVHRLILFTQFVSRQIKRPALILSANTSRSLDKATASLQAEPAKSCSQIEKEEDVKCISFFGDVTVSPEIQVFENGRSKYIPFGTTLGDVMEKANGRNHTFKLLRQFAQEYAEVELPADSTTAQRLTLVGGDKVVWK